MLDSFQMNVGVYMKKVTVFFFLLINLNLLAGYSCRSLEGTADSIKPFKIKKIIFDSEKLFNLKEYVHIKRETFVKGQYWTDIDEDSYLIAFYGISNSLDEDGTPLIIQKNLSCKKERRSH